MNFSQEYIKQLFNYNPATGDLTWKIARSNRVYPGMIAGVRSTNKIQVYIGNSPYAAHRIIWLWYYGHPIPEQIDHKDRNGYNNCIENLRACKQSQNMANTNIQRNNTTGYKGIWLTKSNKWWAYVNCNKQRYNYGPFDNKEDAIKARQKAFEQLFGEFANHE
jgi:hypothetical protein